MSLKDRLFLYEKITASDNTEVDVLSDAYLNMDLRTQETFRVTGPMIYRPDLISRKFFNNPHMGWLIARHNKFMDPIMDFYSGRVINIPDLDDYFRYFRVNARSR